MARIQIDEAEFGTLVSDFKRYRLMFRIIFVWLIFDTLMHFDLLS